jgi:eukaryotic-like serine/threonine-protein kinase
MSGVPERLAAALADRYRLERELGAGGMATVYLAQDLKHDRKVAVKVLRPELAAVIGADRFLSEIRTTANLQHPHILPLFDSGSADGFLFYVMPLIEGESLRDRLNREKQLPIAEAVRLASEVASALHYAHRHGVIHRDIKPENVLLHDGQALVADFGIALAASKAGGSRMTETGMSLGTPHYMSPEQAMGEREITAASDVYALGAMTYEMLLGEPPFTGPTAQSIVAKVMTEKPSGLVTRRDRIPPAVEEAVLTALEKLPADRFSTAAEFGAALASPAGRASSTTAARPVVPARTALGRDPRTWVSVAAVGALAVMAVAMGLRPEPSFATSRQEVLLWKHRIQSPLNPGATIIGSQAAIAPDGSNIVYTDSTDGGYMLMRKSRDAAAAVTMAGTGGAVSPFFSPDGRWVGYVTLDGRVRKVPVDGGGSVTVAEDAHQEYKFGTWLDNGSIVYVVSGSLFGRVPSDGGGVDTLMQQNGRTWDIAGMSPLPGSRGFLFTDCGGNCGITSTVYVYEFATDSARLLVRQAAGAWYSPTGHLLYTSRDGGLFAAPFDLDRMQLTGGAVSVLEGVDPTRFTLSVSGSALYSVDRSTEEPSTLVWVGRDGHAEPVDSSWRGRFEYPAISPDGQSVAVSLRGKTTDLWVRRADGTREKVISEGEANWRPSWSSDGSSIAFISVRNPSGTLNQASARVVRVDGVGGSRTLMEQDNELWEAELSRDGNWLVTRKDELGTNPAVYARRLAGDTTLMPLLTDPSYTVQLALSPDARWLAYVSNEAGRQFEVYVASFPDMASKRLVSRGGGSQPRWSRSGRELFFQSGGRLMAVAVPPGPIFTPGPARALFSLQGYRTARNRQQYDVAPGDQRFVMIREPAATGGTMYVENWFPELLAQVGR